MTHFIGKISLGLQLRGIAAEAAFQWQQQAERFCYDRLLPALDTLFDRLAGPDEVLTIDKLDLDLRGIPAEQWEETVLRQVLENVENQIQRRLQTPFPEDRIGRRPLALSHFGQWLYVLEHGALPPGQAPVSEEILKKAALETVAAQSFALQRFRDLLRREPRALRRLLWQHDDAFLDALLEASAGSAGKQLIALRTEAEILLKEKPQRGQKIDFEKVSFPKSEKLIPVFRQNFQEITWTTLAESQFEPARILQETLKKLFARQVAPLPTRSAYFLFLKKQIETRPASFAAVAPIVAQLLEELKIAETPPISFLEKEKTQPGSAPEERRAPLSEPSQIAESEPLNLQITEPETLKKNLADRQADTLEPSNLQTPKPSNFETLQLPKSETSDWYVRNAGVVLLHPFLPTLFQTLGLTKEGQFDTAEQRQQAVYLLHFAATGQTGAPEFDLVFPKFLCGWDIETPLERNWKLEIENWEKEVETMLQAAIKNWGKLGSTSPDGLRESFLRRPGKLSHRPYDGWQLRLEPSGIDILLDYLPWGVGIVKLPWMKEILNVEWTS